MPCRGWASVGSNKRGMVGHGSRLVRAGKNRVHPVSSACSSMGCRAKMLLEAPNQPGLLQWGSCDVEQVRWVQHCRVQSAECSGCETAVCESSAKWVQWVQWVQWEKVDSVDRFWWQLSCTVGGSDKGAGWTLGAHKEGDSEQAIPSTRHEEATSTALAAARNQSGPGVDSSQCDSHPLLPTTLLASQHPSQDASRAMGLPGGVHDGPGALPVSSQRTRGQGE